MRNHDGQEFCLPHDNAHEIGQLTDQTKVDRLFAERWPPRDAPV
jgi:hypothetical protein